MLELINKKKQNKNWPNAQAFGDALQIDSHFRLIHVQLKNLYHELHEKYVT